MDWLQLSAPFVGAIAFEAIHWYQLRERLHLEKFRRAARSIAYWAITILMIVVGGVGAMIYFGDRLTAGEMLVAGAAFPTLLKKLVGAFVKEQVQLGDRSGREPAPSTPSPVAYFM